MAELSSYTPTLRERLVSLAARKWYGDTREGYQKANRLMEIADFTPIGVATGMYDAGRELGKGNVGTGVAMTALAGLPLPGALKKEARRGIRAFHGSPHSFDKFSMDKIGTGEGAQAYGHGLYFADTEGTAKAYRDNVKDMGAIAKINTRMGELAKIMKADEAGGYRKFKSDKGRNAAAEYDALMEQRSGVSNATGHMYEVNIDANPDQFLDWDKPLSEQPPHIQQIARDMDLSNLPTRLRGKIQKWRDGTANPLEMPTGNDLHSALTDFGTNTKNNAQLTTNLRQQGIPGIKYLDQGSRLTSGGHLVGVEKSADGYRAKIKVTNRGGIGFSSPTDAFTTSMPFKTEAEAKKWAEDKIGGGSRNYVVFDENLVNIVRKYGIAGASAMLGYDILANTSEAQASELKNMEPKKSMPTNRFVHLIPDQSAAPPAANQNRFAHLIPKATPQTSNEAGKSNRELSWADTGKDVVQSAGAGLVRGATGLVGLPGDIGRLAITGMGKLNNTDPAEVERLRQNFPIPGSADITGAVERNVTGPLHESQSTAGDFAETIGEFAPNVIGGGAGLLRKGAMVALPAIASETAGQLTKGTKAEPYARVIGGVTGGLAAAGKNANAIKKIAKDAPTSESVKATTKALYEKLRDAGIKYDSNAYDDMTLDLVGKLNKEGFRAKQAPLSADVLEFIAEHRGKSLEYSDFESIRKVASKILREQSASATDKTAAGLILDHLDEFAGKASFIHNGAAPNAPALMKEARDFARRNIIGKQIDDMMAKAETYQSGYESGLRNQFANYLRSSKAKGLSQTERQAFMDVAKGNFTSNALGTFGKLGIDFGKLGNRAALLPAAAAAGGYAADSAITGGATVLAATGAKYAAQKMTRNATDRAKSTVLAGRDAQKAAQKALKQRAFDVRFNRLKAVDNARKATNEKRLRPIRLPNGSTLWNPTLEDYQQYGIVP